ncbi:MAG: hypothetical protein D6713_07975 [Deltaproteobacteria bacterium]|nr:MAG: hypothetical protein D6713_07975 [Deltaproteobacteria bacterium]
MRRRVKGILLVALAAMTFSLFPGKVLPAGKSPIAVIVSSRSDLPEVMDLTDLKLLFLGKKSEVRGVILEPVNRRMGTPVRVGFDRSLLGMDRHEVKRYWLMEQLKGGPRPFREFGLAASLVSYLSARKRAISYAGLEELTPELKRRVRVVKIRLPGGEVVGPGDSGYPLTY